MKVIECVDLTVCYKTKKGIIRALDNLNLEVEEKTIFGFIGPNGAGKTSLIHTLLGFINATSGKAKLFGIDIKKSIARERIGYLQEYPDTYRFLTGYELLDITGQLFSFPSKKRKQRIEETAHLLDIEDILFRKISTYSRGQVQRICLAQSLLNDPDLLILDEPASGLDPVGRIDLRNLILHLNANGKTIFFSSHELSEVETICNTIAIINKGKIIAQGKISSLIPPGENLERFFLKTIGKEYNI